MSAGDAELQTDVMRFFAILAICVIALTSLVESVEVGEQPIRPAAAEPDSIDATVAGTGLVEPEVVEPEVVEPEVVEPEVVEPEVVAPKPRPAPVAARVAAGSSASVALRAETDVRATTPAAGRPGPSLRFASPAAMLRLVASREIRVFARTDGGTYRLNTDGRRFVPDSLPAELYLMAPETVSAELVSALSVASGSGTGATWGVSLSPSIQNRLSRAVENGTPGLLLIDAAGRILPAEPMP